MSPTILDGIADVASQHDWFIVDQWGVLHDGHTAHPGAIAALRHLRELGPVALVSNTSQRIPQARRSLDTLGFSEDLYDACFTAGELAASWLDAHPGVTVYGLGRGARGFLGSVDVNTTTEVHKADVVVAATTWKGSRTRPHAELQLAVARRLPLLCTNPDVRSIQPDGSFIWCPGAAAEDYLAMGGVVHHFGKPKAAMYEAARTALGVDTGAVGPRGLAFGDSLAHDVCGANQAGCTIVLVTGGIHGPDLGLRPAERPSAPEIAVLADRYGASVDYAISSFRW